jgi:MFS family permease
VGVLVSGVLALVVAMGIGRFAYTPILPLMKNGAGLSDTFAGIVASANYTGYLAGALWSAQPVWRPRRLWTIRAALAGGCLTTLLMGFTASPAAWLVLRFAGGVASAFILILVSSVVLDRAAREGRHAWPGLLYSGVGIGIVLTGIVVPLIAGDGWRASWIVLGGVSVALSAAIFALFRDDEAPFDPRPAVAGVRWTGPYVRLMIAYFGEGLGYVIPATFIVAILRATPQLAGIAASAWVIVGVVAAPSAVVWVRLAGRFGRMRMFALALVILALGVVAPVFAPNAVGAAFSAFALGLTFIGITTLVNVEARALFPAASNRAIGELTAAFGVGQIVGPLIVSAIAARGGSYDLALLAGGAVLAGSAATIARDGWPR